MQWVHNFIDDLHEKDVLHHRHRNSDNPPSRFHLKLRLFAGLAMLVIALIGVVSSDFSPSFATHYWFYMTPVFIIINLAVSWHAAIGHGDYMMAWHELLHWITLIIGAFLVSIFIEMGVISDIAGGIFMLTILAVTTFLAGVHFDSMLMVIGIILFMMAIITAAFIQFSLFIMIPVIIVGGLLILWRLRGGKRKSSIEEDI